MLERALRHLQPIEDMQPLNCIESVEVYADTLHLLTLVRLLAVIHCRAEQDEWVDQYPINAKRLRIILPVRIVSRGGRTSVSLTKSRCAGIIDLQTDFLEQSRRKFHLSGMLRPRQPLARRAVRRISSLGQPPH